MPLFFVRAAAEWARLEAGVFHLSYPHSRDIIAEWPSISVEMMVGGLFPRLVEGPRYIIVIRAYLDDSGTHRDSPVVVVAGFLGSEDEWKALEPSWQARLAQDGVKRFHMTHCLAGEKEFGAKPRWRRDLLIDDLTAIIGARDLLGISAVMLLEDWDAIVVAEYPDVLDVMESPYYTLSSSCIQQAARYTEDRFNGKESLSIIYDCRPQDSSRQRALGDLYKAHEYWGKSIVSISPGNSAQFIPLQAADLFANELYRNHVGRRRDPAAYSAHPRLVALRRNAPLAGDFRNRDALRQQCERFRAIKRRAVEGGP